MTRTCGECVVCCVYPSVDQEGVKKAALFPCSKLIDHESLIPPIVEISGRFKDMPLLTREHYQLPGKRNCTVYAERPSCCKDYHCAWLDGHGAEGDRPDKVGVVVDHYSNTGLIDNSLIAKPLWFGADLEPAANRAMENISRDADVQRLIEGGE